MINARSFDLKLSIESGQPLTFYSDYANQANSESLSYVTTRGLVKIRSVKKKGFSKIDWLGYGYSQGSAKAEVTKRLGLSDDMKSVYSEIETDEFMSSAVEKLRGMRITENDPWETTLCFLVSQFNNMKRIRFIIKNMINQFGESAVYEDREMRLFPKPEAIAEADLSTIRACGTGFRDKYIKSVAKACSENINLYSLHKKDYMTAKAELLELDGIGDKVADCILLFGYKKMESFPIDLWVKRVIENVYFKGRKKNIRKIHEFAEKRWPNYQGYAQQYLYYYGRLNQVGK